MGFTLFDNILQTSFRKCPPSCSFSFWKILQVLPQGNCYCRQELSYAVACSISASWLDDGVTQLSPSDLCSSSSSRKPKTSIHLWIHTSTVALKVEEVVQYLSWQFKSHSIPVSRCVLGHIAPNVTESDWMLAAGGRSRYCRLASMLLSVCPPPGQLWLRT